MRTSEAIYHQVRWDPRFDPARFLLGVAQRGRDPKRMPLTSFVPGGDVPWHRVLFVEADGELVWDRASGLDRVEESGAGRVRTPRRLRAPFFAARTPHAWDGTRWSPVPSDVPATAGAVARGSGGTGSGVRLLTWNTLWDRYDPGLIDTARRRPRLLEALADADADVIALQEVEPALLKMVLAADWVRSGYTLGAEPRGRDVDDFGLLLLSRLPVREAGVHAFAPHKAVTAIAVEAEGVPLVVACTHLSSDHSDRAADRREAELARLAKGLADVDGDVVLLGDFNDGRDGPEGPAAALGLRDAWTEARGAGDRTPTFAPGINPLAAVSSRTGRAARLDRVLLRGGGQVTGVGLLGDVPHSDGLFVSDHFGVRADLDLVPPAATAEVVDVAPTSRTALAWLPPEEMWPEIQRLRRAHDPRFDRWPPHVNLLFGFVPEAEFERAAALVAEVAAGTAPFAVRWAGVHDFGHREDVTVWLDPTGGGEQPWQGLHTALAARFPRCRGRAAGFTPHLSLGRTAEPAAVAAECAAALAGLPAGAVGELVLLSRRGPEPMRVRATITLGSGTIRWRQDPAAQGREPGGPGREPGTTAGGKGTSAGGPRPETDAPRQEAGGGPDFAAAVAERVAAALDDGVVEVAGSRRMGCALPGADLDLVAALPGEVDAAAVGARLAAALPEATGLRHVVGARVPGLRFTVSGLAVDLVLVGTGGLDPAEAVVRRAELGESAAVALSAVGDAEAVRAAVAGRTEAFEELARRVKAWARARGLDSAPHGGLPGLAWTVLAARVAACSPAPDAGPEALFREFLATWAAWNWQHPIGLTPGEGASGTGPLRGAQDVGSSGPVVVLTPSAPVRSCTPQVSAGFRELLVQELYQAWEHAEAGVPAGTPALPPLHRRHAAWALVTVRGRRGTVEFEEVLGRVRGRIRALLSALESSAGPDVHAWPHPYDSGPEALRFAIGLGRTPPPATAVEALARTWTRDLPGVDLTYAAGGEVPTPL
ncbi:RNA repair domain-containing protein [Streptomyces sp. Je 1-79]|uniref:poly(A) polymerase n=1 Tax=Streptomyces sp. Je 1-79 TaxID=2943847 RepID=UPI0021A644D9|nr:poly(A) polymerase [Streptomyces sp. Je 1-79]MCT4351776.1 RNA repair domain-containing protein [Streptomyces sp. Je 1-79]